MVTKNGIAVDDSRGEAIKKWLQPTSLFTIRNFYELTSFYKHFIPHFSTITAPITDFRKMGHFTWIKATTKAFELIKLKLTTILALVLLDFSPTFQLHVMHLRQVL